MLNSDVPIKSLDEDLLGRKNFAAQLAKSIVKYDQLDSFNIGLYGEWGSGKTSTINMIEENLLELTKEDMHKPIILRFNPWMFTDPNQLISQFFSQLSSTFKLQDSKKTKKIGENLQLFGDAIELTSVIPIIGTAGSILSKITKSFGKKISGDADKKSANLQAIKDSLVEELKESNSKVVIFIDDIDRLSNTEIQSVFKLVKSIADFPNTIYLLAFDYDIVTSALGEVQNNNGEAYLEKIVQIPFHLPVINETKLTHLFLSQLELTLKSITESQFDKNDWSILFNDGIRTKLKSMRDVARLNNTISLKYSFLQNEINIVDLLGITTLQVFEPKIYSFLSFYKEELCGNFTTFTSVGYSSAEAQKDELKSICDKLIDDLSEKNKTSVLSILSILFPKIRETYKKQSISYPPSNKSGRISDKNFFDRYFSLSLDEGLSLSQVDHLIFSASENSLKDIIMTIDANRKTNLLLDHINSFFIELKGKNDTSERFGLLVKNILQIWYSFTDPDKDSFFSFPWEWRLRNLVQTFLQIYSNEEVRKKNVEMFFEDDYIALGVKASILLMLENEHNRYLEEGNEKEIDYYQISLEHLIEMENLIFEQILNSDIYEIINDKYFMYIKYLLEKSDEEETRTFFNSLISRLKETKLDTAKLISLLIGHGKASSNFVYDTWNVDYEYISEYFDIENTIVLMDNFMKETDFSKLSLNQQEDIIAFIIYKNVKDQYMRTSVTKVLIDEYAKENQIFLNVL